MSDALLFLPVAHALLRLLFLGQMSGECSMDLFRFIWVLCSSVQSLELGTAGSLARVVGPQLWPQPMGVTLGALHPVLASANPHPERSGSKAKWDGRSCQAGVQCHGCDEQRAKWLLLIHAKGFPPRLFWRVKELEGMAINPTRACLHWTPREFIVLNVLSNFCTAQQLEGLKW